MKKNPKPIVEVWLPRGLPFSAENRILKLFAKTTDKAKQIIADMS